jgi:hypothetical protein
MGCDHYGITELIEMVCYLHCYQYVNGPAEMRDDLNQFIQLVLTSNFKLYSTIFRYCY